MTKAERDHLISETERGLGFAGVSERRTRELRAKLELVDSIDAFTRVLAAFLTEYAHSNGFFKDWAN